MQAGFQVIQATTADDASEALQKSDQSRSHRTDIRMPGSLMAWELAGYVRANWPRHENYNFICPK